MVLPRESCTTRFFAFDADKEASVAVFTGTGGYFSAAGADLKAVAAGDPNKKREIGGFDTIARWAEPAAAVKPVIAAVEGLRSPAAWSLRCGPICAWSLNDATFGVFCRRFGVPLIDLGTSVFRG